MEWQLETDVVVVGGGGCGMVAALAAARGGAEVVLLEKSARLGGNTALSGGSIPAAGTRLQEEAGVEDSPEKMTEDIVKQSGYQADRSLTEVLARRSNGLIEWLTGELGVTLRLITHYKHVGHSVHRLHAPPSKQGKDLVLDLVAALKREGVVVATNSPVTSLVSSDDGAVTGVVVDRGDGSPEAIGAKKVILASNGFGANRDMIRQFCEDIREAPYFGHEGNTGEGIRWGMELGAETRAMASYQGYAAVSYPHGTLLSWTVLEMGGFLVNKTGRRFGNESLGYSAFTKHVLAQPEQLAYVVFDEDIRDYVARDEGEFRNLLSMGGIRSGETLRELAEPYGIDAEELKRTFDAFNTATPDSDPFGRAGQRDMLPLKPPYCIGQVTGGLFHTQGGLVVDENAQPLRKDGTPIGNLYAGGGVACGFSGLEDGAGYTSGNGLFAALGLGKLAGEHAVASIRSEGAAAGRDTP
jgi:fumarate reductase flavoprotein subunit